MIHGLEFQPTIAGNGQKRGLQQGKRVAIGTSLRLLSEVGSDYKNRGIIVRGDGPSLARILRSLISGLLRFLRLSLSNVAGSRHWGVLPRFDFGKALPIQAPAND
jgi:hypothetical protein